MIPCDSRRRSEPPPNMVARGPSGPQGEPRNQAPPLGRELLPGAGPLRKLLCPADRSRDAASDARPRPRMARPRQSPASPRGGECRCTRAFDFDSEWRHPWQHGTMYTCDYDRKRAKLCAMGGGATARYIRVMLRLRTIAVGTSQYVVATRPCAARFICTLYLHIFHVSCARDV